MSVFMLS